MELFFFKYFHISYSIPFPGLRSSFQLSLHTANISREKTTLFSLRPYSVFDLFFLLCARSLSHAFARFCLSFIGKAFTLAEFTSGQYLNEAECTHFCIYQKHQRQQQYQQRLKLSLGFSFCAERVQLT